MPAGFEDMTLNANRGKDSLIDAMVQDGFFTLEQGNILKQFYNIYYHQSEENKKENRAIRMVGRGSLASIQGLAPTVAVNNNNKISELEKQLSELKDKLETLENPPRERHAVLEIE